MFTRYLPSSGFLKLLHASLPFQSLSLIIGEHWTVAITNTRPCFPWGKVCGYDTQLASLFEGAQRFTSGRKSAKHLYIPIINFKAQFRCCHLCAKKKTVLAFSAIRGLKTSSGSCQLTFKRLQVWHPSERSGPPCHPASKGWHNTCYDIPPY